MSILKKIALVVAAPLALLATAIASEFGPEPDDYEALATDYIESRLEDPRAAQIRFVSDPYEIYADIGGYEALPGWAVDVRVKSRLPNGTFGGFLPYTVVFIDGEPVALEEDNIKLSRL